MEIHHEKTRKAFHVRLMRDFRRSVPHWHRHAEILYVLTGRFRISIGSAEFDGLPGDVFVINTGEIHNLQPQIPESTMYVTTFNPELITQLQPEMRFIRSHITDGDLQEAGIRDAVRSLFDECYAEMEGQQVWARVMVQTGLLRIYTLLLRSFERRLGCSGGTAENTRFADFQALLGYLYANYNESITLQDIARQLNYSPAYVSTIFSTYAGQNFKAYLDNLRVNRAADLLKNAGMTVSEIAMQCGFSTLRTFNNTFRRITGTTPTAYRSAEK